MYYVIELIYEKKEKCLNLDKERIIGIDLGLRNIITIVNNAGLTPAIVKGDVVKSINQYYNKKMARYRSIKTKQKIFYETKRLKHLTRKRNNIIKDMFHKISRMVINYCIANNFGTIMIGYNPLWKQKINLVKKNTQNFSQIPFLSLIRKISYKAQLVGIAIFIAEESYTSKCSFLDCEPIKMHEHYSGKRITRGLFSC